MKFVTLTLPDEGMTSVVVNMDSVAYLEPHGNYTTVYFNGSNDPLLSVRETLTEIFKAF